MWDEVARHLPNFESAVLTGVDKVGYPYSVRCHPRTDAAARVLRACLPPGTLLQPGPASLLCHEHDENLWNLKSFLVRGVLTREDSGWSFRPERFVSGVGIGGPMGVVRFVASSRLNTRRYLQKRGLPRPHIPWDEIDAIKAATRSEQPTDEEATTSVLAAATVVAAVLAFALLWRLIRSRRISG